jgi:DNA-binding Lrp family transcriptional regulator
MIKAYVILNCDLGIEKEIIQSLKKIKGVREAYGTLGLYDIIVKLTSETEEGIRTIVHEIRQMPQIQSIMTLTRSGAEELFETACKENSSEKSHQAFVVIHTEKGHEYATLKNLSYISEIREADVIFGFYDVICKIESSKERSLEDIVTKSIRKIPNIVSSMTLSVIHEQS